MDDKKNKLVNIIGSEAIMDNMEALMEYSTDYSFAPQRSPQLVVKANSSDKVQEIVQWANETSTPLIPVSSGPPHFHGDTVPSIDGAVIVDLSGMKRIISIDGKNRMTIVEPGVTYAELQSALARENLRLSTPLLPRRNKSVVASLIEREPTLIPKYRWLFSDPLRCLEVVWGNGHKMMTGEAGIFHSLESAWKRNMVQLKPFGPAQVDYYKFVQGAQGSMGIVTWAALRCERLPKAQKLFFVSSEKLDDLINFAYKLLRIRFGDEFLFLNNTDFAYLVGENCEKIEALKAALPKWILVLGVCGRDMLAEERVEFIEKDIRDMAKQFGMELISEIAGVRAGEMMETLLNPSDEPYWKLRYKGRCQDIFFITTLDKTPQFVATMSSVSQAMGYSTSDIGIYIQPTHQGASCHCEFSLPYDMSNSSEVNSVRELLTEASKQLSDQGAFFSRPYGIWADIMYNRDAQTTVVLKIVKGIFDPNSIMNPGKLCF